MAFTDIQVVTPSNLGAEFSIVNGKWRVGTGVSTDATNILSTGTDSKALLTADVIKANQKTYIISLDVPNGKIKLTDSTGGESYIDTSVMQGTMDDIAISADNSTITFIDKQANKTLAVDFSSFLTAVAKASTNAIALTGNGTAASPLTATLTVDPLAGNLLKVGVNGAKVDPADILALLSANTTSSLTSTGNTMTSTVNGIVSNASIINSNTITTDSSTSKIKSTVNGIEATANAVRLVDSNNIPIGILFSGA